MMRNKEVTTMKNKSTIAKLMSEEDIHVVYKQMDTAYFNPKDRELGLPIWDETKTTADIEDLMVCHEIAHALWTPLDMLEKAQVRKINFSFVNIVEDARIERKVQDKYRGSVAVFKRGYRDLTALDFFGIGDKDVSKLNLIDRINLFFKKQDVEFSAEEQVWVDRVANTKTPEDVLDLAEELYKWMEENESETDNHDTGEDIGTPDPSGEKGESKSPEGSGEENNEGNDNGNNDSKSDADESGSDVESKSGNGSGEDEIDETSKDNFKDSNPEGGTQSSAGSAPVATTDTGSGIDSLRDKDAKDRVYGRIPDTSKLDLVVSYEKLLSDFKKVIVRNTSKELDPCWTAHARYVESVLTQLDTMKKESKKTVAYMVKEFEMKKSADAYARAAVSKTGSLDMGKLHTYKYNDDVFKKVTTLPGATNHGMVMVLDWSGSMAENLEGTVSQLFNLIWFCRQTRIPFVVYAFSDQYGSHYDSRRSTNWENFKSGDIILRKMNLLTLFSSNMNIKEEMEMMHNCLMVSKQWSFSEYQNEKLNLHRTNVGNPIRFPRELNLGGTPLNEAIIAMMDIVPKFKADTGVQKVNTIFLTDGAATSLEGVYTYKLNRETGEHSKDATSCNQYWNDKSFMITDPKTNKTYEVSNKYAVATDTFLEILKNRVDGMNVVGFFIAGKGKSGKVDKRTLIGLLREDSYEQIMEKVKFINKEKYLAISQAGYDEYYILPGGNSLMTENDVLGDELIGASKSKLKAAFGKSMAGKISSRQLLNKFVKLVA
tara:strand:- start:84 stop:2393 length:2310 start_codon:yes stop_codon:yes gene_type:complete